jgi:hypothetical protein
VKRPVALGLTSAIVVLVLTIHYMPPIDDFNPANPFWNGLSRASEALGLSPLEDLRRLGVYTGSGKAREHVLLILGPSIPFTYEEAEAIRRFLVEGGLLILADDFGTGNELLEMLGLDIRLDGSLLLDPHFKLKSRQLPKIIRIAGLEAVGPTFNYATIVTGHGFKTLASSSSFSFLDLNGNMEWDEGEPRGPFSVAAETNFGGGRVIVVSDSSFMINSMFESEGNAELAARILDGRRPLLDISHWRVGTLSRAKEALAAVFHLASIPEVKYSMVLVTTAVVLRIRYKQVRVKRSGVEDILKRHPDWDRKILEMLEEDLRHGI